MDFVRRFVARANRRVSFSRKRPKYSPGLESLEDRLVLNAGGLDPTFGTGGKVLTDFTLPAASPGSDFGRQVAIQQTDGKIVVAGASNSLLSGNELALARYNTD